MRGNAFNVHTYIQYLIQDVITTTTVSVCVLHTYIRTYVPVKHTSVVLPGRSTGGSSLSERKWCDSCGLLASGVTAVMATGCLK